MEYCLVCHLAISMLGFWRQKRRAAEGPDEHHQHGGHLSLKEATSLIMQNYKSLWATGTFLVVLISIGGSSPSFLCTYRNCDRWPGLVPASE